MRTERQEFSVATKKEAWARADGKCEICFQPFGNRRPEYHHKREAALLGTNHISNCLCICPPCHRIITKEQAPVVAKAIRIERKRANIVPRSKWWRPPPRKERTDDPR